MKTAVTWINSIFLIVTIVATSDAITTEVEVKDLDKEVKIFGDFPCPSSLGNLIDPLTPLFNTMESQFGVTIPDIANGQNVCNTVCGTAARCRFHPKEVIFTRGRIHFRCNCGQGICGALNVPFESSVITCVEDALNACRCGGGQTARNCVLPLEPLFPTLPNQLAFLNPIPLLNYGFCTCCTPILCKENEISDDFKPNNNNPPRCAI